MHLFGVIRDQITNCTHKRNKQSPNCDANSPCMPGVSPD